MIPGKRYAPEDYLAIIWRRKWLVFVPLVVVAVGTFAYSRTLPDRYRSQARVLIIPQQVPERFASPTVVDGISARLDLMRQQILSRARLERIVEEFDLYKKEREYLLMDQVIELMRDDINVNVQRVDRRQNPNHFIVSFDSTHPQMAMQVAERLASLFVKENTEGRSLQTEATLQFLQRQIDDSTRQLQDYDRKVEAFRRANAGRMPAEVETSIQLMSNARQQIQALNDGISRDRERQLALERLITDEAALVPSGPVAARVDQAGGSAAPAAQQLVAARMALDNLLLRLKEDHPDVRIARSRIKDLERAAEVEALQQPMSGTVAMTPAEADHQKRLARLRTEFETLGTDIRNKQQDLRRVQAGLADQERLVQLAPGLQSEFAELTRGHNILRTNHEALLGKLQAAKLAANLEQQQVSQQFRIVDPARRPDQPHSPNRLRMNVLGAAAGLGLGLLVIGILEYRDTSLRTDEDVVAALSLPVLALVPKMPAVDVRRRLPWRRLPGGSSAALLLLGALVTAVWHVALTRGWGG